MKHKIVFSLLLLIILPIVTLLFIGDSGKPTKVDQYFAPLITESKAGSKEEERKYVHKFEDGTRIIATTNYIEPKAIRIDSASKEVAEYVQIARARVKHYKIPELIDRIDEIPASSVEIKGDNIQVYFSWTPEGGAGGGFIVLIDIKTKAVVFEVRDGS